MLARLLSKTVAQVSSLVVPRIDLTRYLQQLPGWQDDCRDMAELMRNYGLCYAFDPRVDHADNDKFQDLMQSYFALRSRQFEEGIRDLDVGEDTLPIGLKFNYNEKVPSFEEAKKGLKEPHQALTPLKPIKDPTWRYHFRLNSERNLLPSQFPHFSEIMETWGQHQYKTGMTVAEMTAIGLGLDKNALSRTIENGSLYLSPPAGDLALTQPGDVIKGFHRDLDLFTVHGRSRYSGLYAWLLTGEKFVVKMPENHLLVQGGLQLESLTGGYLKAGFHEAIHNEAVEQQKQKNIAQGKSLWRVASTLFLHVQGNLSMRPLPRFRSEEAQSRYPDITGDEYLMKEISSYLVDGK